MKGGIIMENVIFQPKSIWQKDDCLFCENIATIEAVYARGSVSANIRCCESEQCKKKATKLAEEQVNALSGINK